MIKICAMLIVSIAFSCFVVAADTSVEDVLNLNKAALGGKEAIEKIRGVEIHLTIQEPEFTVDAVYVADRKIRMRIDVSAQGKRVFTEAFDGKNAWQMGEDGKVKEAKPEGRDALRNGIFLGKFFGLYELPAYGHRFSYEGRESVENISYHVLKFTMDNGKEIFLYIHPDKGWVERTRDVHALHPDMDPSKKSMETVHSDFRKIEGTVRSFKSLQRDLKTGKILQTTTVKKVKINPSLPDSLFAKP